MNKNKIIMNYANNNEGIIKVKDIIEQGISKQSCFEFLKKNNFEKIAKGLYISPEL